MIITLLTDFGTQDGYAAAMKGLILSVNPEIRIVDITHDIKPQNIDQAAFVIQNAAPFFPKKTVHVIVVDPGVGGERSILAVQAAGHVFLAPDNGVLKHVFKMNPDCSVRRLENTELFSKTISPVFHGRDIFAPAAAHLASGFPLEKTGPLVNTFFRGTSHEPEISENQIDGFIMHIDRFGNAVSNIPCSQIPHHSDIRVFCEKMIIKNLVKTYSDAVPGEPCALAGSHGYIEIAVNFRSAAELFDIRIGDALRITWQV